MLQDIRQLLEDGSSVDKTSTAGVSMVRLRFLFAILIKIERFLFAISMFKK